MQRPCCSPERQGLRCVTFVLCDFRTSAGESSGRLLLLDLLPEHPQVVPHLGSHVAVVGKRQPEHRTKRQQRHANDLVGVHHASAPNPGLKLVGPQGGVTTTGIPDRNGAEGELPPGVCPYDLTGA
jgi:hypothetical protein